MCRRVPSTAYLNDRDIDLGRTSYRQAGAWVTKYLLGNYKKLAQENYLWNEQSILLSRILLSKRRSNFGMNKISPTFLRFFFFLFMVHRKGGGGGGIIIYILFVF